MLWSKTLIPTLREVPQEAESVSHQLMLRAGLVRMLLAGVYSYLPLGLGVLENIEAVVRQEMDAAGASELLLPALQPLELWQRSGRDKDMGEVMVRFTDRRGRNLCLGPTHEEVITELAKDHISSYRQLPLVLYQIQTKFRDEIRPRFGLVRACEFIMKDAYSFDKDEAGLDKNYQEMYGAYQRIFKRCGLDCLAVEADSGVMGGKVSHEFMVPARDGEDMVSVCANCRRAYPFNEGPDAACRDCGSKLDKVHAIEIGHIFKLGTRYTGTLEAGFVDETGRLNPIVMGCYGIGISRLVSAVIEQNNDKDGIVWPLEVSPYKVIVLPLDVTDGVIREKAREVYDELTGLGIPVLLDDRDERAGVKFKDADLLGIALQVIIGKESLKKKTLEFKERRGNKKSADTKAAVIKRIKEILNV